MTILSNIAGVPSQPGLLLLGELFTVTTSLSLLWKKDILWEYICKKSIGFSLAGACLAAIV